MALMNLAVILLAGTSPRREDEIRFEEDPPPDDRDLLPDPIVLTDGTRVLDLRGKRFEMSGETATPHRSFDWQCACGASINSHDKRWRGLSVKARYLATGWQERCPGTWEKPSVMICPKCRAAEKASTK